MICEQAFETIRTLSSGEKSICSIANGSSGLLISSLLLKSLLSLGVFVGVFTGE